MFVSFSHQAFEYNTFKTINNQCHQSIPKGLITTKYSIMHQNFVINIVLACTNFSYYTSGAIFQFTRDLSHKFIIDLLIICHFSFIDSINLPKKCDNHVLVKLLLCTNMYVFTFLSLCTTHLLCVTLEISLK